MMDPSYPPAHNITPLWFGADTQAPRGARTGAAQVRLFYCMGRVAEVRGDQGTLEAGEKGSGG